MKLRLLFIPLGLLMLSCWFSPEAIAAPGVVIGPVSDSVYGVQGNDFSGASGVDITIRYNSAALAGPQVTQGSFVGGALMAVNVSTPGKIRLALVRVSSINGSGTIATISFTRLQSTGTDIQSVVSSVIDGAGKNVPVTSQVVNSVKITDSGVVAQQNSEQPTSVTSPPPDPGTSGTPAPPPVPGTPVPSATAQTVMVGTVFSSSSTSTTDIPGETSATGQPISDLPEPVADEAVHSGPEKGPSDEKMKAEDKTIQHERRKVKMYPGVLERFKDYKGEKTPKALMALFSQRDKEETQDPPIALSNGKATLTIVLELDSKGENNNFLLDGVSLVSLKNKQKNFWIAELLPDARATEATVSVPRNDQWSVIPLTIAPPMDVNIDRSGNRLTEADFRLYLKNKGTKKAPRFDLNNDGVRNYIDDYIFTANYLSQPSAVPVKSSSR